MNRLALVATILLASPSAAAWGQGSPRDEAAVRQVLEDYRAANYPLDTAKLNAIHSPTVFAVDGGVASRDRQSLVKSLHGQLTGSGKGFRFTALDIGEIRFPSATTAIALATWEGELPGRPPLKGIWLVVLGKHGSRWLLDAWSSATPAK